jgi:hypothetical protein
MAGCNEDREATYVRDHPADGEVLAEVKNLYL